VDSSYIYYCESGFLYQLGISEVQNIEMAVPVYDIVLTTNVTEKSNIFKAMHFFKTIIEEILDKNVILCFITSSDAIQKSEKNSNLSNAQYRFELFDRVFKRTESSCPDVIKMDFIYCDYDRYVSLLYKKNIASEADQLVKAIGLKDQNK